MNIVLVGYRGTGKSAVSRVLAKKLHRKLYSIDDLIVRAEGKPVTRIVEEKGWPGFREVESRVVAELTSRVQDGIIDCGGGVVLDDRNVSHLKRNGKAVLLTANLDTILKRVRRGTQRPPLKEGLTFEEEQRRVLAERKEKYEAAADLVCDTTHKSTQDVAAEIIDYFKKHSWI